MKTLFDSFKEDWYSWSELLEALDSIPNSVTITGTLGLWDGTKEIVPVECKCLSEAIDKCLGTDTNDIVLSYENNQYFLDCSHHDGTNHFTITLNDL